MSVDIDEFVRGYVLTALWSSPIEEDFASWWAANKGEDRPAPDTSMHSFGFEPDNVSEEAMSAIRAECEDFIKGSLADLEAYCERMGAWHGSDSVRGSDARYSAAEQAGGDFWLTRNGHGAGFWDRGLGELGDRLTRDAKPYSESILYVGDDEKVYVT